MGAIQTVKPAPLHPKPPSRMLSTQNSIRGGTLSAGRPTKQAVNNKSGPSNHQWARMFFQLVDDGSGGCNLASLEGIMKKNDPGVTRHSLVAIFETVGPMPFFTADSRHAMSFERRFTPS